MGQQLRRSLEFCGLGTAVPYLEEQGVVDFDVLAHVTAEDIDGMVKEGLMPFMTGKLLKQKVHGFKHPSFRFLGNDVNHRNENGASLLSESLEMFDTQNSPPVDVVEKLLVHGADPNLAADVYEDDIGVIRYTPLNIAASCFCGSKQKWSEWRRCMELLLSHGAHVNQRTPEGWTALHDLVGNRDADSLDLVQLLLQHGADVSLKFYYEDDGREYNAMEWHKEIRRRQGHEPDAGGMLRALQSSATAPRAPSPPECSLM